MKLVFFTTPKATIIPKVSVAKSGSMLANASLIEALEGKNPIVPGDSATIAFDEESQDFFLCHWPGGKEGMPAVVAKKQSKAGVAQAITFYSTIVSGGLLAKVSPDGSQRTAHFSVNLTPVEGHSLPKAIVYSLSLITSESLGMVASAKESAGEQVSEATDSATGAGESEEDATDKLNNQGDNAADKTSGAIETKVQVQDKGEVGSGRKINVAKKAVHKKAGGATKTTKAKKAEAS